LEGETFVEKQWFDPLFPEPFYCTPCPPGFEQWPKETPNKGEREKEKRRKERGERSGVTVSVTFLGEVAKKKAMAMPSAAHRRLVSISTGSRGGWEFTKTEIHEQRGKMQGEWLVTF
jgi:hypothetical protein